MDIPTIFVIKFVPFRGDRSQFFIYKLLDFLLRPFNWRNIRIENTLDTIKTNSSFQKYKFFSLSAYQKQTYSTIRDLCTIPSEKIKF